LLADRPRERLFSDGHEIADQTTQTPSSIAFEAALELQSEAMERLLFGDMIF